MKNPDLMVSVGDLEEGDFFWDSDGDLTRITVFDNDQAECEYWSNTYSRHNGTPDPLPEAGSGSFINWSRDTEVEALVKPVPPVSDAEVAEALASIKAALQ